MGRVTIVGGGVAGLVAAVTAAEAGARVTVFEARPELGGRGRTAGSPWLANVGPHALYADGPFFAWLRDTGLLPPVVSPSLTGWRYLLDGRCVRAPLPLARAVQLVRGDAPVDVDFRTWASSVVGDRAAEAVVGLLAVPTFDADPGRVSASFGQSVLRRLVRPRPVARYVVGGWGRLVDSLVARATALRVEIVTGAPVRDLPPPPVVVATELTAAARILGDDSLAWETTTTALLDVGLTTHRRMPTAALDLDSRIFASRYSAADPTLAPVGHELVQASAGVRRGESLDDAERRIERVLDAAFAGWRERVEWRRRSLLPGAAGALDLPGTTWRDRPAIARGDGVFVAGDAVAAPGLLAEVAWASGREAGRLAAAALGQGGAGDDALDRRGTDLPGARRGRV